MKLIDDFMEKKTQDALRKENEQIKRKARLSELESRKKQKSRMLLHPLKTLDERKEVRDLKKEIEAYENEKEGRAALVFFGGLIVVGMLILYISGLSSKPSTGNTNANEATMAATSAESETESTVKDTTDTETVALSDEQSSSANSTVIPVDNETDRDSTRNETVDQEKTDLIEEQVGSTESEEEIYVLNTSDLKIDAMTDYAEYSGGVSRTCPM